MADRTNEGVVVVNARDDDNDDDDNGAENDDLSKERDKEHNLRISTNTHTTTRTTRTISSTSSSGSGSNNNNSNSNITATANVLPSSDVVNAALSTRITRKGRRVLRGKLARNDWECPSSSLSSSSPPPSSASLTGEQIRPGAYHEDGRPLALIPARWNMERARARQRVMRNSGLNISAELASGNQPADRGDNFTARENATNENDGDGRPGGDEDDTEFVERNMEAVLAMETKRVEEEQRKRVIWLSGAAMLLLVVTAIIVVVVVILLKGTGGFNGPGGPSARGPSTVPVAVPTPSPTMRGPQPYTTQVFSIAGTEKDTHFGMSMSLSGDGQVVAFVYNSPPGIHIPGNFSDPTRGGVNIRQSGVRLVRVSEDGNLVVGAGGTKVFVYQSINGTYLWDDYGPSLDILSFCNVTDAFTISRLEINALDIDTSQDVIAVAVAVLDNTDQSGKVLLFELDLIKGTPSMAPSSLAWRQKSRPIIVNGPVVRMHIAIAWMGNAVAVGMVRAEDLEDEAYLYRSCRFRSCSTEEVKDDSFELHPDFVFHTNAIQGVSLVTPQPGGSTAVLAYFSRLRTMLYDLHLVGTNTDTTQPMMGTNVSEPSDSSTPASRTMTTILRGTPKENITDWRPAPQPYLGQTYTLASDGNTLFGAFMLDGSPKVRVNGFQWHNMSYLDSGSLSLDYTSSYRIGSPQPVNVVTSRNGDRVCIGVPNYDDLGWGSRVVRNTGAAQCYLTTFIKQ